MCSTHTFKIRKLLASMMIMQLKPQHCQIQLQSSAGIWNLSPACLGDTLPPPWNDLSGLNQVRRLLAATGPGAIHSQTVPAGGGGGVGSVAEAALSCGAMHRLVVNTQLVSITFRCFSLPTVVANFLNPDVDEATSSNAHVISEFIASSKARDLDTAYGRDEGAAGSEGLRGMRLAWEQLSHTILPGEGPDTMADEEVIDHCLLDSADREQHQLQAQSCTDKPLSDAQTQVPPLSSLLNRVLSLGPHGAGPNLLLFAPDACLEIYEDRVPPAADNEQEDEDKEGDDTSAAKESKELESSRLLALLTQTTSAAQRTAEQKDVFQYIWSRLRGSVVSGFQMLTASGPLMQEPLQGVCFSIEKVEISARVTGLDEKELQAVVALNGVTHGSSTTTSDSTEKEGEGEHGTLTVPQPIMFSTGQLISDVRESLRLCMLGCALRLVEPIYKCSLQCDQLQLGNLYAVLSRRRGEVTDEDIIEGTSLFILTVSLPVANSFGFAQELLHKTSGSGTAPQLFFSHWSINDQDPFWKPTTSEEQEEHGTESTGGGGHNLPRTFIDGVRRRKGLVVEEKLVVYAEKQRTLTRNK